jgi:hypothetical protein
MQRECHQPDAMPVKSARLCDHSAIHAARHDVTCAMHLHMPDGISETIETCAAIIDPLSCLLRPAGAIRYASRRAHAIAVMYSCQHCGSGAEPADEMLTRSTPIPSYACDERTSRAFAFEAAF